MIFFNDKCCVCPRDVEIYQLSSFAWQQLCPTTIFVDINCGSLSFLLQLFNFIIKIVASDEVEIILITIVFAIINPTVSYHDLITLKFIIEVSLSFNLIAELYRSRLSFLILRAGRRIVREKNYRYRFTRLSSSFQYILIKSDNLKSS